MVGMKHPSSCLSGDWVGCALGYRWALGQGRAQRPRG